jgi:hypothetical protein
MVGPYCILLAGFQPASSCCADPLGSADEIGAQDAILPHYGSCSFHIEAEMPGDLRRSETSSPWQNYILTAR